jgi:hypothetical protein
MSEKTQSGLLAVALLWSAMCLGAGAEPTDAAPQIEGCRNVEATERVEEYNPRVPQTTFMSSMMEGATQGFSEGLSPDGRVSEAVRRAVVNPTRENGAVFNELPRSFRPYCRAYDADRALVSRLVAELMNQLGNPILVSDEAAGIFQTAVQQRGARSVTAFSPAWRDSYVATVEEAGPNRTVVRIFRNVHVARDPGIFNQGVSTGRNEKWLFTQIADRLQQ